MSRPAFVLGEVHYDLSHLAPIVLECPRLPPIDGAPIRIEVAFSHHCYTVTTSEDPAAAQIYHVIERGDVRLFNAARWELSRSLLPGMIAALPNAKVEHTWEQRNYRYAVTAALLDGSEYQMFFSLRKSGNNDTPLRLFVESAYPVPAMSRPRGPGVIRFAVLATHALQGKRIKQPPRR